MLQATQALVVRFTSDSSVSRSGFALQYDTSTQSRPTRIPPPGGNDNVCSKRGQRRNDGSCTCSVGFTGEACGSRVICCDDPARCHDSVCEMDPRQLIVVAGELGDDTLGREDISETSELGTISKAVASLSKAIALASDGDTIFVYPGVYKGSANRNLVVTSKHSVTIRTLRGSNWTKVDCERQGQGFDVTSSVMSIEGLTIQNCMAPEGASLRLVNSEVTLTDTVMTGSSATQRGGAMYASVSNITMIRSTITRCSASSGSGGGLYLASSSLMLNRSNISGCSAVSGGAIALTTAASALGIKSNITDNSATSEGGGVSIQGDATIAGVLISANSAGVMGGGLAARDGKCRVVSATVAHNVAGARGGGFAFVGGVDASIIGSSIRENRASVAGGGIHYQGQGSLTLAEFPGEEPPQHVGWLCVIVAGLICPTDRLPDQHRRCIERKAR